MTADPGRSGPAWGRRRRGGPRQVIPVRLRRVGPAERIQMLTVGGRVLRVATRDGNPGRPPLLLCNGIGGRLELFQPFVDALDPRRGVPDSQLHVYHGGHLELGVGAERLAPVVEAFLDADLTAKGRGMRRASASRPPTRTWQRRCRGWVPAAYGGSP
jgi:hypothetical protein